jgi:hypothetical protein
MRPAGPVSGINDFAAMAEPNAVCRQLRIKGERCCTASIEGRRVATLEESPMSLHKFSTGQVIEARTGFWAAPLGPYEIIRRLPPSDDTNTA